VSRGEDIAPVVIDLLVVVVIIGSLSFAWKVLNGTDRSPKRAYLMVAAGVGAFVASGVLTAVLTPIVVSSWNPKGSFDPALLLVNVFWIALIGTAAVPVLFGKRALQHLRECYSPSDMPAFLRTRRSHPSPPA
jgi:hypothetical protein